MKKIKKTRRDVIYTTILLTILLIGCNTGSRAPVADLQYRQARLHFVGFGPGTQYSLTEQQRVYWYDTLVTLWAEWHLVPQLRAEGVDFYVYADSVSFQQAFLTTPGKGVQERWPALNISQSILGFTLKKQVHVMQGYKQTAEGFAGHLLTHVLLESQTGHVDQNHRRPDWGIWDRQFQREALALAGTR